MRVVQSRSEISPVPVPVPVPAASPSVVMRAVAVRKSYRHGVWPARRTQQVLRGVDLELGAGEVVGTARWPTRCRLL